MFNQSNELTWDFRSEINLATQASTLTDQNLENSLKRIDQDVRKSGRISRRDIEDVLEEIRNTRSATSSQSLLVIRCCGNLVPEELPEIRTKLVQEIWNTLNKLNVPMDISHYNALLRVYLENEHPFSPTEFLSELESKGIDPNRAKKMLLFLFYNRCLEGSREDGTPAPTGAFFIKQLVKAERPIDKIIKLCLKLEEEEMYDRALLLATETSLQLGKDNLAYSLLEYLSNKGIEIRQHYFWPLIVSKAHDTSGKGIIGYCQPAKLLGEYVIPNLGGKSSEILAQLREGNISIGASACSLVMSLLQRNEIKEAAIIARQVQAYYYPEVIRRPLTNAFIKTNDLEAYMTVFRSIYENLNRKSSVTSGEEEHPAATLDKSEVVGSFILDLAFNQRFFFALVWRFLNSLAEIGDVEKLNKVFDTLVTKELIDVSNVLLGPLIKVHLTRKEFDKALEKFEWCVNRFRATPWKNELACQLIQAEDAEKLQKITDLSTAVHGEVNSLYDLVFAFVECGRVRQARKILETPGLQNRPQRINSACERYQQEEYLKVTHPDPGGGADHMKNTSVFGREFASEIVLTHSSLNFDKLSPYN
ncbi:hypothetical protein NQ317_004506 [Molorchus minor]|uniref:Uncharacterized protein n=1 Tax=Molorchus minor TaxID=1323400 RepID=A0ABQ9JX91_9CUCU|nr:hypothetical protein NQ317_004506 [Molorchus minor]